jgi:hypothetical protein
MRKQAAQPASANAAATSQKSAASSLHHELDYLDIPAFLRRKEEVVE